MNVPLRILIAQAKKDLATCAPKHRERIRRRLKALLLAQQIRKEDRAA